MRALPPFPPSPFPPPLVAEDEGRIDDVRVVQPQGSQIIVQGVALRQGQRGQMHLGLWGPGCVDFT